VCRARDPKGLWQRCERGEISGLTGFDAPYEVPLAATMRFDTEISSASSCASQLVDFVVSTRTNALLGNL
jgi:adenylylsulfate kinase